MERIEPHSNATVTSALNLKTKATFKAGKLCTNSSSLSVAPSSKRESKCRVNEKARRMNFTKKCLIYIFHEEN